MVRIGAEAMFRIMGRVCAVVLAANLAPASAELRAGFRPSDITADVGVHVPGFFEKKVGTAISDPLYAVAAAFESGEQRAIIIGADVLCITEEIVGQVREQVEKKTGVPGDRIMIGASHTHTGGPIRWLV